MPATFSNIFNIFDPGMEPYSKGTIVHSVGAPTANALVSILILNFGTNN